MTDTTSGQAGAWVGPSQISASRKTASSRPSKTFREYSAPPPQAPQALPHLPPNVYTNRQATVPSAYNILLFDNVATGLTDGLVRAPENLMLSQQQAQKYLKTMPEGTQVAILQLATGLHIVQGFTSDRDLLLAAVGSLKAEAVHGTLRSRTTAAHPHLVT